MPRYIPELTVILQTSPYALVPNSEVTKTAGERHKNSSDVA